MRYLCVHCQAINGALPSEAQPTLTLRYRTD